VGSLRALGRFVLPNRKAGLPLGRPHHLSFGNLSEQVQVSSQPSRDALGRFGQAMNVGPDARLRSVIMHPGRARHRPRRARVFGGPEVLLLSVLRLQRSLHVVRYSSPGTVSTSWRALPSHHAAGSPVVVHGPIAWLPVGSQCSAASARAPAILHGGGGAVLPQVAGRHHQ